MYPTSRPNPGGLVKSPSAAPTMYTPIEGLITYIASINRRHTGPTCEVSRHTTCMISGGKMNAVMKIARSTQSERAEAAPIREPNSETALSANQTVQTVRLTASSVVRGAAGRGVLQTGVTWRTAIHVADP